MKLWEKDNQTINQIFERFTIGNDPELDLQLAIYDVNASLAHINMITKIGLLNQHENQQLKSELNKIRQQILEGTFKIEPGIEDCHSQIELQLIKNIGNIGKKVHSGRSRNDQILVALKLYVKHELENIAHKVKTFFELLQIKSEDNKNILMPGYTHMQVAMPSSFGLFFGAYAESLAEDLILLVAAHKLANKNPLGSGAGYGSSFPLDRQQTTDELKFHSPNYNALYAQMTRGKLERNTAQALSNLAATLAKYAMDVCLFSGQDFNFFIHDNQFTTGSSIMPHKQNPDGFELVRAKCNLIQALPNNINAVLINLPTGYHRDLQILKEYIINGINTIKDCLDILFLMTKTLKINQSIINQKKYDLLFTVEEVNRCVNEGMPFRDAYQLIGNKVKSGKYVPNKSLNHTHIGSIGNLATEDIKKSFEHIYQYFS